MKRRRVVWSLGWLLLLVPTACGDQTGTPQPLPIPCPQLMRLGAAPAEVAIEVDLVGLSGAVAGAGSLVAVNGTQSQQTRSSAAGSFYLALSARGGDVLQVRFGDSEPALIEVPVMTAMVPRPPTPIDGVAPVTPRGGARVLVQGQLAAAGRALVANASTGAVALVDSDGNGRFAVELGASSGESLRIYEERVPLGPAWLVMVP